jgi:FkbM family methyltransferase
MKPDAIRMALWSPVPPQDAPISYYTADLVSALAAEPGLELDIFVDDYVAPPLSLLRAARVHHHSDFDRTARQRPFDAIVYQVGASPSHAYMEPAMLCHPGIVVMHDLRWSRALLGSCVASAEGDSRFRAEVDSREGERAAREWDRLAALPSRIRKDAENQFLKDHPMLGRIVDTASCRVAVTGEIARQLVRRYPHAHTDSVIPVGVRDPQQHGYGVDRASARAYLDLEREAFTVLVPATDVTAESIESALVACAGVRSAGVDAVVAIVGSFSDAAGEEDVRALAERFALGDAMRVTGAVSRVVSEAYLAASDAVVMLDDDATSDCSDPVNRAFAAGRCLVVRDSGASQSLPASACIRVKASRRASADVTAALLELARDDGLRETMEQAARTHYEQTARLRPMVEAYLELIRGHAGRRPVTHRAAAAGPTVVARAGRPEPRPGPLGYSKVCELEDFAHPHLRPVIRDVCAHKRRVFGDDFPTGYEYRKDWEVAMAVRTLGDHGVLRPDARVLGVAAGTEDTVFYLTRHVGEVVAIDRYREPGTWAATAPPMMLVNPCRLAPFAFRTERLTVQHMDARILDYPDESFDGIFSSGSIEHFGDVETIAAAAYEMGRVLKPGGVLTLSTELLLSCDARGAGSHLPGTFLLSPSELLRYIVAASGLEPIDELDLSVSHWTLGTSRNITHAVVERDARLTAQPVGTGGRDWAMWDMPHIVMEWGDKRFTSVHLALRRAPSHPVVDNSWAQPTPALRAEVARGANGVKSVPPFFDEIRALASRGDAALKRLEALCREADAASAAISADLQEASLPHAGVYGGATPGAPRPAASGEHPSVTPALHTVEIPIASTVTPPYTVVVQQDAEDIISTAFLAGHGATINTNLISLLLALVPAGGVLLDIGANIGSISLPLAVSGRHVLSVEADSVNARLLGMSALASGVAGRIRVVSAAVSDRVGEATFMPHGCHGQLVDGDVVGATRVPLTTVDSLIDAEQLQRVDLVKIDVEGADLDVVRGMTSLAARDDAPHVLVECCPFTLAAYRHTVSELVSQLEEYGYVVYNVDDHRLMRRRPDEVQVTTVMDVLAVKHGVHGLPDWRVEPPISRRELIERLIAESRIWNPDCRASAARVARELHPDVLDLPAVAAVLDGLSKDPAPIVRAAAAWWNEARAASGVSS